MTGDARSDAHPDPGGMTASDRSPAHELWTPTRLCPAGPWRESLALFFALFFFYVATSSKEWPRGDAGSLYSVANAIIERHTFATSYTWRVGDRSRDGRNYSPFPLLHSLVHLPGEYARVRIAKRHPGWELAIRGLAGNVGPAWFGALTGMLFFRCVRRLGASRRVALGGTLALGLGTFLWVFSRTTFVESVHCAAALGFFHAMLAFDETPAPTWRQGSAVGAWAGLLINAKLIYFLCLPGAVVLALTARRRLRPTLAAVACAALAFLPFLGLILFYDHVRFGSIWKTG